MTKTIGARFVMKNALNLNTDLDYYECRNENPFSIQQTSAVIFALILMKFLFGGNSFGSKVFWQWKANYSSS